MTAKPLPAPATRGMADHMLSTHPTLTSDITKALLEDLHAAVDASHMPRGRQAVQDLHAHLLTAFTTPNDAARGAAADHVAYLCGDFPVTVRTALLRPLRHL